jgi:hypothetical protein
MFRKLIRALLGEPQQPVSSVRIHESGQLSIVSTQEIARRRMYERMAQHQRLIEIEEDLQDRFWSG